MSDYINQLVPLIYDPQSLQMKTLETLKNQYDGELDLPDASNPFMFLLENSCMLANATAVETSSILRKMFPSLATSFEDLYPHIRPNEINNLFGKPSSAWFNITIKVDDIEKYGISKDTYIELEIPELTKFVVSNEITFINTNPIIIKLFQNSKIFVLKGASSIDFFDKTTEKLESTVTTDNNGIQWLNLTIELTQLDYQTLRDYINNSSSFYLEIPLNSQYYYNSIITNNSKNLNISYSPFYFDKDNPTVIVKVLEDKVKYHIPDYYIINNIIYGNADITQFVTKGKIVENIINVDYNDVKIIYPVAGLSINNVVLWAKPITNPYGGENPIDFDTLRNKVITHSTGDNVLPITYEEIDDKLSNYNLTLVGRDESVTKRFLYVDFKDITDKQYPVTPDILAASFTFNYENVNNTSIVKYNNSYIINPFNIFRYENGLVLDDKVSTIEDLDELNEYLTTNKVFYNIHKYIIDSDNITNVRVYDILNPKIEEVIETINSETIDTSYILEVESITRSKDNYYLNVTIKPDDDTNIPNLKLAYYIPTTGYIIKDIPVTYDEINKIYTGTIPIETSGYIDSADNYISTLTSTGIKKIPISHIGNIYLYTTDTNILRDTSLYVDIFESNEVVLVKQVNDISLCKNLRYINADINITYTDRKYKRYTEDVPLVYTENVYLMDENGIVVDYIDTDGDGVPDTAEPVILHKEGDVVLDDAGNIVYKYRAGDVMLDETGEPIIDTDIGLRYTIRLLVFEYVFKVANDPYYKERLYNIYDMITDYCTNILDDINKEVLENTILLFKPKNNPDMVKIVSNNITASLDNFISPIVDVYLNIPAQEVSDVDIDGTISYILQYALINNYTKYQIEDLITETIGSSVVGINVTLPETLTRFKIYEPTPESSRILIQKKVTLNGNYIAPKLDITINKITVQD